MIKVCRVDAIEEGSMFLINIDKKEIVIGKHNGRIVAFDAYCPHRYAYLHRGYFKDNNVVCPLHNFEYDLDTGKLVKIDEKYEDQNEEWKRSGDLRLYKTIIKDGYVYLDPFSTDSEFIQQC